MKKNNNAALWGRGAKWLLLGLMCATVASCGTSTKRQTTKRSKEYFSEKEYGVKASPRVYTGRNVPKGGGRDIVGKPYQVKGKWYAPKEDKKYDKVGTASWYGSAFHGRLTANGEVYDQYHLSAAHPTFPLPSYARVTNVASGDSVIVRVNDRGPYHPGRIIDLSNKAADMLDLQHHGTGVVRVQYVGRARMDGRDMPFLMASFSRKGDRIKRFNPQGEIATGVMVASNEKRLKVPDNTLQAQVEYHSAATALQSTADPAALQALAEFEQFVMLPEFGPYPADRPVVYESNNGALSAYVEARINEASSPFEVILASNEQLTPESIRQSELRRNIASQ
ncbi:septal ring lytic transglycosylase RlpA family protein [Rhizobium sp. KVB221]|uniref:Endolytic peptidoglycan transglycosylase RlpA n=1 Tax=Rhizobium setariae TaxID=2801340 RepID=A0A936YM17_9HYPH|nr:septal ring lytic transglycosylase RlpA family protein [Rhizobium setariae]MBL0372910.1 septal ring lytic transglycosylase RlpA family protein [Rhizobium setariae]